MLYSATSIAYILLVDDMSISERVEYSTLLSFMVMFWTCSVYDYFDRGRIFLPFISFSFRCIFFLLRGKGGIFLPLKCHYHRV